MAAHETDALLGSRRRRLHTVLQVMLRLAEHPGIHHRGPTNHHAADLGLTTTLFYISTGGDVAVANDRHLGHFSTLANHFPIGFTRVSLGTSASVNGDRLHAAVF